MAKHLKKIICALILSLTIVFASACSFFETGEVRQIARIYSVRSEDEAGTYIVVEYEGDEYENDRFFIPDPERGPKGNGIMNIESEQTDDGQTRLTIYYEDPSMQPKTVIVPNGTFIKSVDSEYDAESGKTTLTIYFSDPTVEPVEVVLESGKDGINGDRIQRFYVEEQPDENGNIVVHVVYSHYDEVTKEFKQVDEKFTMPRGAQGRGVRDVQVNYQTYTAGDDMIYLDIYYDDDSAPQTLSIPRANAWHVASGNPGGALGNVGDFYFDTTGYKLYRKTSRSAWTMIADFSGFRNDTHTVTFDLGDTRDTRQIQHGESFYSINMQLDIPQKAGYVFLGWYTKYVDPDSEEAVVDPNSGHFTDLTVVNCDLILYPRWSRVAE